MEYLVMICMYIGVSVIQWAAGRFLPRREQPSGVQVDNISMDMQSAKGSVCEEEDVGT